MNNNIFSVIRELKHDRDAIVSLFAKVISSNRESFTVMDELISTYLSQRGEIYSTNARTNDFITIMQLSFVVGYLTRMDEVDGTLLGSVIESISEPTSNELNALIEERVSQDDYNKIREYCEKFANGSLNFDDLVESVTTFKE